MRTNIEIDDAMLAEAMKAGPYKTKKEAVEAGLMLLARKAAYQEILKWKGKLRWTGDDDEDWSKPIAEEPSKALPRARVKQSGMRSAAANKKTTAKTSHGRR